MFCGKNISLIVFIIKEPYILVFMQKSFLILLISCSKDVWLPILDPCIEYPYMARLPIITNNYIKTHMNHHVGPVVDTSFPHNEIFVHICRAIEYSLLLGWVTLQTGPMNTLDMLVVIPIYFRSSDANHFWCDLATKQSQDLGEWLCIHIVPQTWLSIFDGSNSSYIWCYEWTCPGPECLMLNPKLVNTLTHFLFWLVTLQFTDHSNHCYVIFRDVVILHVYKTKLDSFKNDKL